MSSDTSRALSRVGVVGAGQLALMMGESARDLGLSLSVLANSPDESATTSIDDVVLGSASSVESLRELAQRVDVITFDHELVDLEVLEALEADEVILRPGSRALRFAVDKAFQRRAFFDSGLPVPRFLVVRSSRDDALAGFLDELGDACVIKASRGGYDGRGVGFPATRHEALSLIDEFAVSGDVLVEERLALRGEVAQLVARASDGQTILYPVVATLQRAGMCAEVRYPSELNEPELIEVQRLSERVAALVENVGIMAIEYFVTAQGVLINEVALRPHNSGHWTIEGTTTSQFAQHLRAVSGLPLGEVIPTSAFAVMVNVVGAESPGSREAAQGVHGVFVHDYAKSWRPGRKLGHVTALGEEPEGPRVRAWQSAHAYGTQTQEA
ncbi:MAG TPA: 5-(carboxyamino)imidazole ribonucleotide synthase [Acidimicrobiales bacterium]|nr:5-(carboxyamino)imidazole ribonucleotide synthase [Acidimicrobiales bacterium]